MTALPPCLRRSILTAIAVGISTLVQPVSAKELAHVDRYGDPLPPGAVARLGTLRLRHAGSIRQVVFSPDGKRLASASDDETVRLWDAETGKELYRLRGNAGSVSSVAFSPDGKLLASGTHGPHGQPNHPVFLWDAATGKQLRCLRGHKNEVQVVTFSPDGKTLASAGYGKSIRLWDVASGKERRRLQADTEGIYALAFSADGRLLASGGGGKIVHLWDVDKGMRIRRLRGHHDTVLAIVFLADGKTLASAERAGMIRLWNVPTGKFLRQMRAGRDLVCTLAIDSERKALVSGGIDVPIRFWDSATGRQLPFVGENPRGSCSLRADGKRLASWNDQSIRLWDAVTGKERISFAGHQSAVRAAVFRDEGKTLLSAEVSRQPGYRIDVWDGIGGRQRRQIIGPPELGRDMIFSPDGAILAATGEHAGDKSVRLWDVKTSKKLHTLVHGMKPTSVWGVTALAYAPDGRMLATAGGNVSSDPKADYFVYLWDTRTGRQVYRRAVPKETIGELCFSPDGRLLASANWGGTLCVRDAATGKKIRSWKAHKEGVRTVVFAPDGRLLASSGQDGTIGLWETVTGGQVRRLQAWATKLAFSPDGKMLASVNGTWINDIKPDNALRLWDVRTGETVGKFTGHPDGVTLLLFAPDGQTLISGGEDSTLLSWDLSIHRKNRVARQTKLTPDDLQHCWDKLADRDATVAYQAIGKLATAPQQAVSLLSRHMRPESPRTPPRIAALINRLDDDSFRVREKATAELIERREEVEPALRRTLAGKPSLEVRRRVERILEKRKGAILSSTRLRDLRALAVLEHIGTAEAQAVLKTLAGGVAEARLTREAKASLRRLTKRHDPKP